MCQQPPSIAKPCLGEVARKTGAFARSLPESHGLLGPQALGFQANVAMLSSTSCDDQRNVAGTAGRPEGRLWVDLRNPWDTGPSEIKWGVIDPVSGRNNTQFRGDQPQRIAALAAKHLRESVGGSE
eukprot:s357_g7.t1